MNGSTPRSSSRNSDVTASLECTVEKTMWPVLAAWQAIDAVSWSRISPIMMTSGSCRRIDRSIAAKVWPGLGVDLHLGDVVQLVLDRVLDGDDVPLVAVDLAERGVERRGLAGPGRPAAEEHAVRLGDQAADLLDQLGPHPQLLELGDRRAVVEDTHDQLLAGLRARGGHAEVQVAALELGAEGAVLRLALLGDVHRREDLEDVDHGVAGGPVERLGGVEDAVDPVPHRELLGGRLEVDVGRPAEHGVVDQLLGGHERSRFLGLADPRSGPPWPALASCRRTGSAGRPGRPCPTSLLNSGLHPQLHHQAVGHLAEVVGRQDLLVVGDGLVRDVDVGEQGDEVRQEQQAQPDRRRTGSPAPGSAPAPRRRT